MGSLLIHLHVYFLVVQSLCDIEHMSHSHIVNIKKEMCISPFVPEILFVMWKSSND